MLDTSVVFQTDGASLLLFDASVAKSEGLYEDDSYKFEFEDIPSVRAGKVALVRIGGDGVYKVRLTDGPLTQDERDYAAFEVGKLGVEITSGQLSLSGYWFDDTAVTLDCPNGAYWVTFYDIAYHLSPRWWRPDGKVADGAPAHYVVVLEPRRSQYQPSDCELFLDHLQNWQPEGIPFLFDSTTRVIGAQVGMILESTVIKSKAGLYLKECGPDNYRAELTSYNDLKWKDRVRFRVLSVDRPNMIMHGELIERI